LNEGHNKTKSLNIRNAKESIMKTTKYGKEDLIRNSSKVLQEGGSSLINRLQSRQKITVKQQAQNLMKNTSASLGSTTDKIR